MSDYPCRRTRKYRKNTKSERMNQHCVIVRFVHWERKTVGIYHSGSLSTPSIPFHLTGVTKRLQMYWPWAQIYVLIVMIVILNIYWEFISQYWGWAPYTDYFIESSPQLQKVKPIIFPIMWIRWRDQIACPRSLSQEVAWLGSTWPDIDLVFITITLN